MLPVARYPMKVILPVGILLLSAAAALAGDPPSLALSRCGAAHLDQILGPLEQNVSLPRNELVSMRQSFLEWKAKAPPNEQPGWAQAIRVCDALNIAMDERANARVGMDNAS